jgi:hypothetical protein
MSDPLFTNKSSFLVVLDSRNATEYYNDSWNSSVKFDFEEPIRLAKNFITMTCSVFIING